MCLVFISHQPHAKRPLAIGANREESHARPATSPVCRKERRMRSLLAGADHGPDGSFPEMGTWLGVNEAGLAVAVTNRGDSELAWADQTRSRGLLAVRLLDYDRPKAAAQVARDALSLRGYGGCNLLIAAAHAAYIVQAPGSTTVTVTPLNPGIHAMTNLDMDDDDDPRIRLVRTTLEPEIFIASAGRLCRDDRIIIAGAHRGTVSSSLIVADEQITLYHILGDPRGRDYSAFLLDPECTANAKVRAL